MSIKRLSIGGALLGILFSGITVVRVEAATTGEGTAVVISSNVAEGSLTTSTLTFTAGPSTMATGGSIVVQLPIGWGPTLQNTSATDYGYVTATATPATFSLSFPATSPPSVKATLATGSLSSGNTVVFTLSNIGASCGGNSQKAFWTVASSTAPSISTATIAVAPFQTIVTGSPQAIAYFPWTPLTVIAGNPSTGITLHSVDNCQIPVNVSSPVAITLTGQLNNGTSDTNALFSSNSNFSSTLSSVTIAAGNNSASFYYLTTSVGSLNIVSTYPNFMTGPAQSSYLPVSSLSSFSFSNIDVDAGTALANQTTLTISPNGTGTNSAAYIRFLPSNLTVQWHVTISSDNFQTVVFDQWGTGDPKSSVVWDGKYDTYNYAIVPNGNYTIKIETPGLAPNTTLSVTVNTAQISGNFKLNNNPVAGVYIGAQSTTGQGYSFGTTDSNGNYVIYGLQSGGTYNLFVSYTIPSSGAQIQGNLNNVTAPTGGQNFSFSSPGEIRVAATISSPALIASNGNINVNTSNFQQGYGANIEFVAGSTTSDNANPVQPSTWSILFVQPNTYNLQLNIAGYGTYQQSNISVASGQDIDIVVPLTPQAAVYGKITLPAPVTANTWVPINGTLAGNNYATVWGGTQFNVGQSSAIYAIYSVAAGVYSFTAYPPNLIPLTDKNITVGTSNLGNPTTGGGADFSGFSQGGTLTGTLTLVGDSRTNGSFVNLSANSQALGIYNYAQVPFTPNASQTSTSYSIGGLPDGTYQIYPYLQNFSITSSPQTVTISGGIGSLNMTLQQNSGQIAGTITLPAGKSDYNKVHLSLQGPSSEEVDLGSGPAYSLSQLGSGNYSLTATYQTTGDQIQQPVSVINGQATHLNLDLSAPTYSVSGTVSITSAFTMSTGTGTATINTLADLLANATNQAILIGGQLPSCSGGTSYTLSTARVEAFPRSFNSFQNANRNGFSNCFGVGQYIYGLINADGTYSISGLYPGVWDIDVYPYFDGGTTPDAAVVKKTLTITSGNASGINFTLSNGNAISGTLSLPIGINDALSLNAQVLSNQNDVIQSAILDIGSNGNPANSVSYSFKGLPPGNYVLAIHDPGTYDSTKQMNVIKYVTPPLAFTIAGSDLSNQNITMQSASSIVGKLAVQVKNTDGTLSQSLITSNNESLLPSGFSIAAQASPWVQGGYQQATQAPGMSPSLYLDSNNQFHIQGLVGGTYNVQFSQNTFGTAIEAKGSLNLANLTVAQQVLSTGQTLDIGTITLVPGLSVSGTVKDSQGTPLPNVPIQTQPSVGNNKDGSNSYPSTFSDGNGQFTITGLDPALKNYDFIAAPRPGTGDNRLPLPYGQVTLRAIDVTQNPAPTLSFVLPSAHSILSGQITTADGGAFSFPDSDQAGYPAAAIYLQRQGDTNPEDNPLGNIEVATGLDGSFTIPDLVAGVYTVTINSLGYTPRRLNITLNGNSSLGTITLQRGGTVTATLTNTNGTPVNTSQVKFSVAVSADLSSVIFGQINSDPNTKNIISLIYAGFPAGISYSILLFDSLNNIIQPPQGKNISFTDISQSIALALSYKPSAPITLIHAHKSGSSIQMTYYFTGAIRNTQPTDQTPSGFVSVVDGAGTLTGATLSSDRLSMTVFYNPAPNEQNATIRFSAPASQTDPATGTNFMISRTVTLLLGQQATAESNINPLLGGNISLADYNDDPSNVILSGNSLLAADGSPVDVTTTYSISLTATDSSNAASSIAGARSPGLKGLLARGPSAYVGEAYNAMAAASALDTVSPLSSFYSILLPQGLSHTLTNTALLTLHYNTGADPNSINVYYFDGQRYILQNNQRVVDLLNNTITVAVNHFSTFVVLQNNAPVITVNGSTSANADIEVFNFPNPFDLQPKTKTLSHGGTASTLTTNGTIIRYTIPASMINTASIVIYDIVGEKVRTIDLGTPPADTYEYVAWDGKNDAGNNVASGVYIGELKVGSQKRFFKMAVIK